MDNKISLDQLYYMVASIYSEANEHRPISATFSHFVEVCGMLSIHDRKKKKESASVEDALCKALGWYFPLMAKLKVKSIEDLIFRKYPYACPYCRQLPHNDKMCKTIKGTESTVNHDAVKKKQIENAHKKPISLNEWQEMFNEIYPRSPNEIGTGRSTIGLLEELGEMAEAIRVFDRYPKYLAGEAADVFSYIMGIANEHNMQLQIDGKTDFNFEKEMLKRYPGICPQCGYKICICPNIPESTVGRMSKELDLIPLESLFDLKFEDILEKGNEVGTLILKNSGGYSIVNGLPIDRGEINRAIVLFCLNLAKQIEKEYPEKSLKIRDFAIEISSEISKPGSKGKYDLNAQLIQVLSDVWEHINFDALPSDNSLGAELGESLQLNACKFGVITALPKEFAAMRQMFDDSKPIKISKDPNEYVIGKIPANNGKGVHLVILTLLKEYGTNFAASAVSNLVRSFPTINDILMVGIAGGIPNYEKAEEHVRLGDIVISEKGVIPYDHLKINTDKIEINGNPQRPSANLLGKVRFLETLRIAGKRPWENYISRGIGLEKSSRPDKETDKLWKWDYNGKATCVEHPYDPDRNLVLPKIHYGVIGSSNILIKNPNLRNLLSQCNVKAVEMEGSGISDASWDSGIKYLVIRGISDYCDSKKNDIWQGYAALVAATYARALIESYDINE